MSTVINLFGSAGSGKSTGAAFIFSMLKLYGLNVEYVNEYAKDKVWEENHTVFQPKNQPYIFGKQLYKIHRLLDKVDYVITDCPLLLSNIYVSDAEVGMSFKETVRSYFTSMENLNYFIKRVKAYNPVGRNQKSSEEADKVLQALMYELNTYAHGYSTVDGNLTGYLQILSTILKDAERKGLITLEKINETSIELRNMMVQITDIVKRG